MAIPTKYRYTVQILGIVDAEDYATLQSKITAALAEYPGFHLKTLNMDEWIDGITGEARLFDELGNEVSKADVAASASEE